METFKSLRDYVNIIESGGPVSWSSKCVQLDLAANSSDGSSELRLVTGVVEDVSSLVDAYGRSILPGNATHSSHPLLYVHTFEPRTKLISHQLLSCLWYPKQINPTSITAHAFDTCTSPTQLSPSLYLPLTLARTQRNCRPLLDMPLTHEHNLNLSPYTVARPLKL